MKAIFLTLYFISAKCWYLHLQAIKLMFPLFYTAYNANYTWDNLYYLQNMQNLPEIVWKYFLERERMVKHKQGVFSGM